MEVGTAESASIRLAPQEDGDALGVAIAREVGGAGNAINGGNIVLNFPGRGVQLSAIGNRDCGCADPAASTGDSVGSEGETSSVIKQSTV